MRCLVLLLLTIPSLLWAQPLELLWQREGAGDHSRYGAAIFGLGDQNGDGYADWGVTSWGWGDPGQPSEARTDFYFGGDPPAAPPWRTYRGQATPQVNFFGATTAGDLTGDGLPEWSTAYEVIPDQQYCVRLYRGGALADTTPVLVCLLRSGVSLWPLGDFNGDGYDDLYRYDWDRDLGQVLFGGAVLDTVPDWTRHSPPEQEQQALPLSLGDLNGDGCTDFLSETYANQQSHLHLFWGGSTPDTMPGITLTGGIDWLGITIVNDLNGDGRDDLVKQSSTDAYEVRWGGNTISRTPDLLLTAPCTWATAEWEATGVGDVNGDGWNDLVVSEHSCGSSDAGSATLYLGSPWMSRAPAYTFWGGSGPAGIRGHYSAAGLRDVNGDGVNDFALGGFDDTNQGFRGRAVVVAGSTDLIAPADDPRILPPSSFILSAFPNPFNSATMLRFSLPAPTEVTLTLCDVLGRQVLERTLGPLPPGEHSEPLHADGLASGVYFVRLQSSSQEITQKLMLLK